MAKFGVMVKQNDNGVFLVSISDGETNVNVYIPGGSNVSEEDLLGVIRDFKKALLVIYENKLKRL